MSPKGEFKSHELPQVDLDRLKDQEYRPLLKALLQHPTITYEDMARVMETKVGTLRTRRHRDPLFRSLLIPAGKQRSSGGRAPNRFKLNEYFRDPVERIVSSGTPDVAAPLLHNVPQLQAVEVFLERANDERHQSLMNAYRLWTSADVRLEEIDGTLQERKSHGKLHFDNRVWERIVDLKNEIKFVRRTIDSDSVNKLKEYLDRESQVVDASRNKERIANYFSHVPKGSLSGFGGAINARSHAKCHKPNLDEFLAERIDNSSTHMVFVASIGHAVHEAIALTAYDSEWVPVAHDLLQGVRDSPPISTLSSVRNALTVKLGETPCDPSIGEKAMLIGRISSAMQTTDWVLPETESIIGHLESLP